MYACMRVCVLEETKRWRGDGTHSQGYDGYRPGQSLQLVASTPPAVSAPSVERQATCGQRDALRGRIQGPQGSRKRT